MKKVNHLNTPSVWKRSIISTFHNFKRSILYIKKHKKPIEHIIDVSEPFVIIVIA